ncbi:PIN domain-containing protein [Streptomyces sp. NBC_00620]|nr:PIN domain-containing protein [Streptomyces sp. NBC_00620]
MEVDEAIKSSVVILDTNAVLNLYRMKPSARREYLQVLKKIESRIWIPRKVADEFHENRLSSVSSHVNSLKKKSEAVSQAAEVLRAALRDFYKLHSLADGKSNEYLTPLNSSISDITGAVEKEITDFDLTPEKLLSRDPILEELALLFDGKVGDEFSDEVRDEVEEEALRRGKEKIPPGYVDVQKKNVEGVGDYFIWRQMLDKAKSGKESILFVSTDTKEDWVRVQCGLPVGPRPELVREMRNTAGVAYYQLPLAVFLSRAARVLDVSVSQDTIDQVNARGSEETRSVRNSHERHILERVRRLAGVEAKLDSLRERLGNAAAESEVADQRVRDMRTLLHRAKAASAGSPEGTENREVSRFATDLDIAHLNLEQNLNRFRVLQHEYEELLAMRDSYREEIELLQDAPLSFSQSQGVWG